MAVQNFYFFGSYNSCPIEAITYLNASGITDPAIRDNYCKFVKELKDNGVYSLIDVLYPDLGSNASQNKLNAINPVDSDSAFRRTFGGGMTFSPITGTKGNGTNAFFDTHYNTSKMSFETGGGYCVSILTENVTSVNVDIDAMNPNMALHLGFSSVNMNAFSSGFTGLSTTLRIDTWSAFREPSDANFFQVLSNYYAGPVAGTYVNTNENVYGMSRGGTLYFSAQSHGGFVLFKNASIAQATAIRTALINMNARR